MSAKYLVVADELRRLCAQMRQSGQSKLPTEEALCAQYACSRQTVRHAMSLLEEEGLLKRRHGSGSYLCHSLGSENDRIALVTNWSEEYLYPRLLRDISVFLSAASYKPDLYCTENQTARERSILAKLLEDPPAAILLEGTRSALPNPNLDLIRQIVKLGIPLVFLQEPYPELAELPSVVQDNAGGAEILVRYLLGKKHRNIAALLKIDNRQGLERYRGYLSALADAGAPFREQNVFWYTTEDFSALVDNRSDMLERFVRTRLSPCTAVVCQNDAIAYHLIRCLLRLGKRVPDDVAVVSFDNSYYCTLSPVSISSLGHERQNLSRAAADAVLNAAQRKDPLSLRLPWILKERESG